MPDSYAVEMLNITKRFPGVLANDGVDFRASWGEIHALIGENGAGKSTLMKALYGIYRPDSGVIRIDGKPASITSPRDAIRHGIGMVHQKFMLALAFTALENIILGQEPTGAGRIDYRAAEANVMDICIRMGLSINLRSRMSDMSVSSMQKVEILKALYRGARILILDEPTSILAPQEAERLFMMLRRMASESMCIILISHKLSDVMAYSHSVTVLRNGKLEASVRTLAVTPDGLARHMIGADARVAVTSAPMPMDEKSPILEVRGLCVKGASGNVAVDSAGFDIRPGDILGVAGVDGNGQQELVEALMGLRMSTGSIVYDGQDMARTSVAGRIDSGMSYIPENPESAVVPDFTLAENVMLGYHRDKPFCTMGIMNPRAAARHAETIISGYDISATGIDMHARFMSGGSQQKLIIGRALESKPRLLILSQPTRGLDVSATADVHRRLLNAAASGAGIFMISYDLDEILAISARIMVMYEGRIAKIMNRSEATKESIGAYMVGALE